MSFTDVILKHLHYKIEVKKKDGGKTKYHEEPADEQMYKSFEEIRKGRTRERRIICNLKVIVRA